MLSSPLWMAKPDDGCMRPVQHNPKLPPTLAITLGDPGGIGPEIVRQALRDPRLPLGFRYHICGEQKSRYILPGRLSRESARVAVHALEEAFALWKTGAVQGIVTAPIHKANMARIGFRYPGHTEYFAAKCHVPMGKTVMAFYHPRWSLALVSAHCPLRKAIQSLSVKRIVLVAERLIELLKTTGKTAPRIAIAGLNPHAGENSLLGSEEKRFILPAIAQLRKSGCNVVGPHAPDSVFRRAEQGEFDGVVAAYHDQGLIPFKLLHFSTGVNITLGLPLIRTSPDHGTAVDLAGTGRADYGSMLAAIRLAAKIASHQARKNS